ncbi:hypothetical protein [Bradyrhizobium sp. 21]|uniref:hypothetical protein n=1 Tax=Bradyrhizobium sp. 21 TaxID=2782666 RepID=UPI001FF7CB4D|nr:hypothetical protein [Bradyrhizobium sp. 21]
MTRSPVADVEEVAAFVVAEEDFTVAAFMLVGTEVVRCTLAVMAAAVHTWPIEW